jgi:hypothetical protein
MAPKPLAQRLYESVLIRVSAYYLLAFLILQALPESLLVSQAIGSPGASELALTDGGLRSPAIGPGGAELGIMALAGMIGALAMSLPVAWIYTLTRGKRGYSQSVVQLLVALPPVVTGIVVLVQYSVALAFSLAGIVAAVRFRNSLDDSKDAVYAFLAIGIGICSAVNLYVAFVLSAVSAAVSVFMWYTDFGKSAQLEGAMAQKRLERALANASRTGTFVARIDKEIFEHMSPEQLEAAAARALKRKTDGEGTAKVHILRFVTQSPEVMRAKVEGLLGDRVKQFSFVGTSPANNGGRRLEYTVSLKKKDSKEALMEEVKKSLPELEEVDVK